MCSTWRHQVRFLIYWIGYLECQCAHNLLLCVVAFVVLLHLFNGENPSLGHVLANIQCKITKNGSVKENHISMFCACDSCILRFSMMCHRVDISCWHVLRTFRGIDSAYCNSGAAVWTLVYASALLFWYMDRGVIRGRNLKLVVAIVQPTTQSKHIHATLTLWWECAEVHKTVVLVTLMLGEHHKFSVTLCLHFHHWTFFDWLINGDWGWFKFLIVTSLAILTAGEVNEDRLTALRKRAEVDSKSCIIFVTHEPSEMKRSMARLDIS